MSLKNTGYTSPKNNEHCNNYTTKTKYCGGVKNRAVHFDFRLQRIPRTVNPRAGTTQAESLRRFVRVVRGPRSNRSNVVQTSSAYTTETMHFQHSVLWQRISYEAQRIDCGVVAKSAHALNALSAHTEMGWIY